MPHQTTDFDFPPEDTSAHAPVSQESHAYIAGLELPDIIVARVAAIIEIAKAVNWEYKVESGTWEISPDVVFEYAVRFAFGSKDL